MVKQQHQIKAIETVYKGYRFRSRLEARWAVFFDALGIKWEYEKEGYDLDGVRYLPDFWLPEFESWVEVKGEQPNESSKEIEKATRLVLASHKDVYIVSGPMDVTSKPDILDVFYRSDEDAVRMDHFVDIVRCPICRRVDFAHGSDITCLRCGCWEAFRIAATEIIQILVGQKFDGDPDAGFWLQRLFSVRYGSSAPSIENAYLIAQQSRFEFGENGGPR